MKTFPLYLTRQSTLLTKVLILFFTFLYFLIYTFNKLFRYRGKGTKKATTSRTCSVVGGLNSIVQSGEN